MSIVGVGKPVSSQLYLMQIAGLVLEGRRRTMNPSDEQIRQSRYEGREMLKRMTGADFGYDVQMWFDHMITDPKEDHCVTHPYGFASMRKILQKF